MVINVSMFFSKVLRNSGRNHSFSSVQPIPEYQQPVKFESLPGNAETFQVNDIRNAKRINKGLSLKEKLISMRYKGRIDRAQSLLPTKLSINGLFSSFNRSMDTSSSNKQGAENVNQVRVISSDVSNIKLSTSVDVGSVPIKDMQTPLPSVLITSVLITIR